MKRPRHQPAEVVAGHLPAAGAGGGGRWGRPVLELGGMELFLASGSPELSPSLSSGGTDSEEAGSRMFVAVVFSPMRSVHWDCPSISFLFFSPGRSRATRPGHALSNSLTAPNYRVPFISLVRSSY